MNEKLCIGVPYKDKIYRFASRFCFHYSPPYFIPCLGRQLSYIHRPRRSLKNTIPQEVSVCCVIASLLISICLISGLYVLKCLEGHQIIFWLLFVFFKLHQKIRFEIKLSSEVYICKISSKEFLTFFKPLCIFERLIQPHK